MRRTAVLAQLIVAWLALPSPAFATWSVIAVDNTHQNQMQVYQELPRCPGALTVFR